jgi:Methylase involved in ubiquinone/menaquinone biosynthesis
MNEQNFNCIVCESPIVSPEFKKIPPSTMDSLVQFDELKIISCPECHFSFATERISDDDLNYYYTESYSGIAKKVGQNVQKINAENNFINYRYLSQIELIRKFHNFQTKDRILEIGSGVGHLFRTMKHLNIETSNYAIEPGVDAHPTLEYLGVNILKMSVNKESLTKIPKNSFDIIIMSHSLEHFNSMDISEVLNGVFNSLKPGGHFLCEVPNANLIKYPNANELVNPHLTFFSIKSIKKMFLKIGFEIVFLSACGKSQNSKTPPSKELIEDLKKTRFFDTI